ncbi:MAG: helix-turn-helix domain-containing protein [Microbacteriaceae bacterium]
MTDPSLAEIGPRLRELRRRRDLSLETLGERTGISPSTLSRLESGKRRAQLDLLLPIARALDASLDEIVGAADRDPRVHRRSRRSNGIVVTPLSRPGASTHVAHIRYSATPGAPSQRVHEGRDWVYVLSGRLRLLLGDQDLVLEPGEAAEFATTTPHWMGSTGEGPVEVLGMFGPHGELEHAPTFSEDPPPPSD